MCIEYNFANYCDLEEILALTKRSDEEYEAGTTYRNYELMRSEDEERERYYRVSR